MANLILKPSTGGVLKLQNDAGTVDALSVSTGGNLTAAGTLGVTGNTTLAGTANNLGTSTAGTLSSGVTFPAGHIIQVKGTDNYHTQSFDTDEDVIIEVSLTNVLASSYVSIFGSTTVNLADSAAVGFESYIYRKASTMGSAGTAVSGATKINATGGNSGAANFTYQDISGNTTLYLQSSYWCIDESPSTGTNYYALVGSGYSSQTPALSHDGNSTIIVMEIAQ